MLYVLLIISAILNFLLAFVAARYAKRVLEFDDLFSLIQSDIDENLDNFNKLKKIPLLSDSQEILHASNLMKKMKENLYQYVMRVQEMNSLKKYSDKDWSGV